jgi:hypothetical protein
VIVWQLDLQLPVQLVPITTKLVSSKPVHGKVYSIQHYVIKFVSDLQQVSGFLQVLRFPPPIKLTATIHVLRCFFLKREDFSQSSLIEGQSYEMRDD